MLCLKALNPSNFTSGNVSQLDLATSKQQKNFLITLHNTETHLIHFEKAIRTKKFQRLSNSFYHNELPRL